MDRSALSDAQIQWRRFLTGQASILHSLREQVPALHLSPENFRLNVPVGDKMTKKLENHTRVYAQNVNGFKLDQEGGDFTAMCKIIKEVQADVTCVSEHNVDCTKHYVNNLLRTAARRFIPLPSELTLGTTPISTENVYKPGGTLLMSVGDVVGRRVDSGSDSLGRPMDLSIIFGLQSEDGYYHLGLSSMQQVSHSER